MQSMLKPWHKGLLLGIGLIAGYLVFELIKIFGRYEGLCNPPLPFIADATSCTRGEFVLSEFKFALAVIFGQLWWIPLGLVIVPTLVWQCVAQRKNS